MTSSTLPLTSTSRAAMPAVAAASFRVFSRRVELVTNKRFEIIDLTGHVAEVVAESGVDSGVVHVQTLHTTTALFLNERQAALLDDVGALVRLLVDDGRDWRHNDRRYSDCDRGNAAAHLRSLLVGHCLSIQIEDGRPVLGKWQAVLFLEMDGPQSRKLSVQVLGLAAIAGTTANGRR